MRAEHNAWEQIASDERNQRKKTESEVSTVLAVPCCVMPCRGVLRCGVAWRGVACCGVLCYAMSCCAVMCCGVLWCGSELQCAAGRQGAAAAEESIGEHTHATRVFAAQWRPVLPICCCHLLPPSAATICCYHLLLPSIAPVYCSHLLLPSAPHHGIT